MIRKKLERFGLTLFFTFIVLTIFLITSLFVLLIGMLATHFGVLDRFGLRTTFPVLVAVLAASAIVGTIVSMVFGRVPLRPIREIINATNRLAAGDFSVRITTGRTPELRELRDSFNRMASELGSIEVLRKDFVNNFSHEFKTPIVSIKGFAELLQLEGISQAEREEYLDIIVRESTRLATMATNVLNLSRVENQSIVTDRQAYDLSEQIRRCIVMMQGSWEPKGLVLDLELAEVQMIANEELLQQVWVNLLDNAIKFSREGGHIDVALTTDGATAQVVVRDDGRGIPAEDIPHVFDKFFQSDSSRAIPGNGLGLALVHKIVTLHGGSIVCESPPGGATAFTVRLPLR